MDSEAAEDSRSGGRRKTWVQSTSLMVRFSRLILLPLFLLTIALAAGCAGQDTSTGSTGSNSASNAKVAPDFTVNTLGGEMVSLTSLVGGPLVINFAASWCGPCELEAPVLAQEYEIYKDRVKFFSIAVRDDPEAQRAFAQRHGLKFPIGLDPNGKILYDYQKASKVPVSGLPTTFFIDKDGVIKDFYLGPVSQQTFEQKIGTILPAGAPATATTGTTP